MVELADAPDSKSGSRKGVGVRFSPPAPLIKQGVRYFVYTPLIFPSLKKDGLEKKVRMLRCAAKLVTTT